MKDPSNYALAQFESFSNYRFHRHVTGPAAVEAASGVGNGRIACFVSAPGSAGTLAAGDHIKSVFPDSHVIAVEPYECSTLSTGGRGQHRVEGIGDKMCILIHNVLTTDFIIAVHDDHAVQLLKVMRDGTHVLEELGMAPEAARAVRDQFGVSGLFNVIAAVRMARWLRLGPDENVVTVATDGFDRYQSVVDDLDRRSLETTPNVMHRWISDAFANCDGRLVFDCRRAPAKQRLFAQKEADWVPLGWSIERLDALKHQDTWEAEYAKVGHYNEAIRALRG
ncbi:MAG: Cysteine synthase [Firmicutes bacterium ADurb.Bin506]|nr:MAG: Cysteine synthase [Firmicutes bacterium ADurb.Bin506]